MWHARGVELLSDGQVRSVRYLVTTVWAGPLPKVGDQTGEIGVVPLPRAPEHLQGLGAVKVVQILDRQPHRGRLLLTILSILLRSSLASRRSFSWSNARV